MCPGGSCGGDGDGDGGYMKRTDTRDILENMLLSVHRDSVEQVLCVDGGGGGGGGSDSGGDVAGSGIVEKPRNQLQGHPGE